jgi:branched-subunit amino acid transport protein
MNQLALIAAMALTAYGVRVSGFYLSRVPLPPALQRALGSVPLAVMAALLVVSLPGQAGEGDIRLLATIGAGLALWWARRAWVGLLVGVGLFWLLRLGV